MYFKVIKRIVLFAITVGLCSCQLKQVDPKWEKELRSLEINLPLDSMEILLPKTGIPKVIASDDCYDYRYVVLFDSSTCSSCSLKKMGVWNSIIRNTKEIGAKVDFIFIMQPRSNMVKLFKEDYYAQRLNLRFYLDTTGIMQRYNPLLGESDVFKAFVLNRDNHIEVIGNAGKNLNIEEKYYKFLKKKLRDDNRVY